ncbi:nucleolar protein Nop56-like protein (nucleomorph) [Lotharella oceanica]|uniref:Nucleolar protein Nop56-like protein n=2 Tax=Lotharella oceanica TaxID=641309 RepID=A0A060DBC2_9EUKA|nr:nucleolar protein Nop56-like protein [Lotharella oceanica]
MCCKKKCSFFYIKININHKIFHKHFFYLVKLSDILKNIIKNFKNYIIKFYSEYFSDLIKIPLKFTTITNLLSLLLYNKGKIYQIKKETVLLIFNLISDKNITKKIIFKYIWYNRKKISTKNLILINYVIKSILFFIKLKKHIETYIKKLFRIIIPNIYNFFGFNFTSRLMLNAETLLNLSQLPISKIKSMITTKYLKKNLININSFFRKINKHNFYYLKNDHYYIQKIKSFLSLKISILARIDIYIKNLNEKFIIELKKKFFKKLNTFI